MSKRNETSTSVGVDRRTAAEIVKIYGMPQHTQEVPDVAGMKLGFSELCMHCEVAGQPVSRLFKAPWDYGYALLENGRMVHGSLFMIREERHISLS